MPAMRLRELSDTDRLTLLRLTEQVGQIAERLEGLKQNTERPEGEDSVFRFESAKQAFRAESANAADMGKQTARSLRPALPDPRLVRLMIRQRQKRMSFFDSELFADPLGTFFWI